MRLKLAHASDVERAKGLVRFGVAVVGVAPFCVEEGGTHFRGRRGEECTPFVVGAAGPEASLEEGGLGATLICSLSRGIPSVAAMLGRRVAVHSGHTADPVRRRKRSRKRRSNSRPLGLLMVVAECLVRDRAPLRKLMTRQH